MSLTTTNKLRFKTRECSAREEGGRLGVRGGRPGKNLNSRGSISRWERFLSISGFKAISKESEGR